MLPLGPMLPPLSPPPPSFALTPTKGAGPANLTPSQPVALAPATNIPAADRASKVAVANSAFVQSTAPAAPAQTPPFTTEVTVLETLVVMQRIAGRVDEDTIWQNGDTELAWPHTVIAGGGNFVPATDGSIAEEECLEAPKPHPTPLVERSEDAVRASRRTAAAIAFAAEAEVASDRAARFFRRLDAAREVADLLAPAVIGHAVHEGGADERAADRAMARPDTAKVDAIIPVALGNRSYVLQLYAVEEPFVVGLDRRC
mmetsp:Transcript_9173/g.27575  ORF Transcript_9173/g.27575 Transcript_9173/m.27575 type:complete len:258 (-) Transcript_9173:576-1349(-)